ncbi:maleylacetoacetate isomerase [Marinobacterium mangrovicola]|uniref:Maleylacetoacetate isomerase n=1 Tax=Marinobacterium mangrovicola TaxID=1476959 RepID=A0A4R1GLG4_9GAMM|nr:maleylacetoacetate isomerase [Marinobacterium mangrovicola]TCK09314.1 maleylacetoacetate isomerase [Marinobacterium mangrovicola]
MTAELDLYTYWRSSAAYRVRIALNLKKIPYNAKTVSLIADGGEQKLPEYARINPQKLVPSLVQGEQILTQSMAILEYLDEVYPHVPLLPETALERARVRSLAQVIACDIHPVNNLRVLQYLGKELNVDKAARDTWYRHWITEGFTALETLLDGAEETGKYCHGDMPTMADIALIPQIYNARRFDVDLTAFPTLLRIEAACNSLEAFIDAAPEQQPDAVQ